MAWGLNGYLLSYCIARAQMAKPKWWAQMVTYLGTKPQLEVSRICRVTLSGGFRGGGFYDAWLLSLNSSSIPWVWRIIWLDLLNLILDSPSYLGPIGGKLFIHIGSYKSKNVYKYQNYLLVIEWIHVWVSLTGRVNVIPGHTGQLRGQEIDNTHPHRWLLH